MTAPESNPVIGHPGLGLQCGKGCIVGIVIDIYVVDVELSVECVRGAGVGEPGLYEVVDGEGEGDAPELVDLQQVGLLFLFALGEDQQHYGEGEGELLRHVLLHRVAHRLGNLVRQ